MVIRCNAWSQFYCAFIAGGSDVVNGACAADNALMEYNKRFAVVDETGIPGWDLVLHRPLKLEFHPCRKSLACPRSDHHEGMCENMNKVGE